MLYGDDGEGGEGGQNNANIGPHWDGQYHSNYVDNDILVTPPSSNEEEERVKRRFLSLMNSLT